MGNLCCSSKLTTKLSELELRTLNVPPSQVPKIDNNFEMDQVHNNSEVKLVVVGESGCGKTCALQAYM